MLKQNRNSLCSLTFSCNLSHNIVVLQVEKRCSTYYHPCCKLHKVELMSTSCNMLLQIATQVAMMTLFSLWHNDTFQTCNAALLHITSYKKCCLYYFTLTSNVLIKFTMLDNTMRNISKGWKIREI